MFRLGSLAVAAFLAVLSPSLADPYRGDSSIDAQWAAQLRPPVPVEGAIVPIDLGGRTQFRELPRGYVVIPEGYQRAPNGYRYVPQGYRYAPQGYRVLPDIGARPRGYRTVRAPAAPPKAAKRREIGEQFLPTVVDYDTSQAPGTIVVDPSSRHLYLVQEGGKAKRYGIGVGREGFGWSGSVKVGRKAEWPTWTPPAEMRKRQPDLPVSMAGGPDNPLGARALYLYQGGKDTLFRIHGSNEPWTIGQAVSSGCFRMRNEDVVDLYDRVKVGAKVVVL